MAASFGGRSRFYLPVAPDPLPARSTDLPSPVGLTVRWLPCRSRSFNCRSPGCCASSAARRTRTRRTSPTSSPTRPLCCSASLPRGSPFCDPRAWTIASSRKRPSAAPYWRCSRPTIASVNETGPVGCRRRGRSRGMSGIEGRHRRCTTTVSRGGSRIARGQGLAASLTARPCPV